MRGYQTRVPWCKAARSNAHMYTYRNVMKGWHEMCGSPPPQHYISRPSWRVAEGNSLEPIPTDRTLCLARSLSLSRPRPLLSTMQTWTACGDKAGKPARWLAGGGGVRSRLRRGGLDPERDVGEIIRRDPSGS